MGHSVVLHSTAAALLDRARDFLLAREAERSLILGITLGLPAHQRGPLLLTVEREGVVEAVALRTAPHKLLVTDGPKAAMDALREDLRARAPDLPGVTGPAMATARLARGFPGARATLHMRLHALEEVADVPVPPGHVRVATPSDAPWLEGWAQRFVEHSGSDDARSGAEIVRPYLDHGSLYLWEDGGEPTSMAGWSRGTPHGASISMVYTPSRHRGRGYATALVARLSQELLARGKRFCVLFTNLLDPTANAIYARIGYRPLGDHDSWSWPASGPES